MDLCFPENEEMAKAVLRTVNGYDSQREAARELNTAESTLRGWAKKSREILYGCEHEIPNDHFVKGKSTLYNTDGEKVMEWVKTNKKQEDIRDAIAAAVQSLNDDVVREKPTLPPKEFSEDLASCYVLTDYHLGQMAWSGETGEDWNMEVAQRLLTDWFARAINSSENSELGILCQLGDFLHWDGLEAVTPSSGHVLDADTRYHDLVDLSIKCLRNVIGMMLEKHNKVHVIMAEGNHDLASSVWLRALFSVLYEDEPRVTVDNTHTPFYCYEWGKTSLFFHHGHKQRMANISSMFAGLYREVFGRTTYSYAHMGHMHHVDKKENQMMIVEQHPTLSAKDAHSTRGGYLSRRAASVITYSKQFGEVKRLTIRPEMIL